nr:hypothetical protein GCM10025699_36060 [Microbacterium flavescens]
MRSERRRPQLPAPDFDAIEAGTTATGAVKSRVRVPWRFLGNRALFYLFTLWAPSRSTSSCRG